MNNKMAISGRILTPEGIAEASVLIIENGVIQAIQGRDSFHGSIDLDVGEQLIAPGFIDIHIHGAKGHHLMTSDREGILEVLRYHMMHGTTGLLATTTTADHDSIQHSLSKLKEIKSEQQSMQGVPSGASILGAHIEGPYLNPVRAGAQNSEHVRLPDLEEYQIWEQHGMIRMITLAPEMPGAEKLVRYIRENSNVLISAGHTEATFEQMMESVTWGVSHGTHFTNAMSGFAEDEPGVYGLGTVGAGLLHEEVTVELIADGIHVHPGFLELIYRVKGPERIALITDAVPFCGMADGVYKKNYGDRKEIVVHDGSVRMKENGGLAGSGLTMDRAVKQMAALGIPLTDLWKMAAAVPARLIGEHERKGTITPGKDADLVIMDDQFNVQYTIIGGHISYDRKADME